MNVNAIKKPAELLNEENRDPKYEFGNFIKLDTFGNRRSSKVKLKLLKKGHCMVKANAPGVPGQWNPFSLRRSYHGV